MSKFGMTRNLRTSVNSSQNYNKSKDGLELNKMAESGQTSVLEVETERKMNNDDLTVISSMPT
jgi:hypothetical protein